MSSEAPVPKPILGVCVDAGAIAKPFRDEIKKRVKELTEKGIEAPLLVGLLANNDPAAVKYAEWTGKSCRNDGLRYELRNISDPLDVERALIDANEDPRVHGVIVYYPIFGQVESFSGESQDDYLRDTVSYKNDVEGLCHTYRTNLFRNKRFIEGKKCVLPCTALSVVKILESVEGVYDANLPVGKRLEKQVVTVINRSEIVGRPLAAMLANDGADVYSIDIDSIFRFTKNGRLTKCDASVTPESCVRQSSIVVTGVPTKAYRLPTEWIKKHTVVVNVSTFKNVDKEELLGIEGVTYIPQVGKVTVAMLERNLMRLFENYRNDADAQEGDGEDNTGVVVEQKQASSSSWGSPMQIYTAATVTVLLALTIARSK